MGGRGDEPSGTGIKGGAVRGRRENCVVVENLSSRTTWKDLKDFARTAGKVEYTDIWSEKGQKFGVIKFDNRADYKHATKSLDDQRLDGNYVRVRDDGSRSPSYRRSRSGSGSRSKSRSRSGARRSRSASPQKKSSRSRSRSRSKKSVSKGRSKSRSKS